MLSEQEVLRLLKLHNAVITDSHIVYTSGKHGSAYVNKDALYPHTYSTSDLCFAIAEKAAEHTRAIQIVIAPAIGGVILSQWTAFHLTERLAYAVLGVYAEKDPEGEGFVIKRGYDKLVHGKNVLVVEDVLNTGGSVEKVVDAVRRTGGNVVGVGALCNRGNVKKEDIGDPPFLFALANIQMDAWDESECPLCLQGVPINTQVGKGKEFLARQGK